MIAHIESMRLYLGPLTTAQLRQFRQAFSSAALEN